MSATNPHESDLILGGQNPPPINAAVLGGLAGRKQRLQYEKAIAREQKIWHNFGHIDILSFGHTKIFVGRPVVNFIPGTEITNPNTTAYAIRGNHDGYSNIEDSLLSFSQSPNISKVQSLIFGNCGYDETSSAAIDFLANNPQKLPNLKSLFLGDIIEELFHQIPQFNVSPVLKSHQNLEILRIRGGGCFRDWGVLRFDRLRHEKLKALTIESGGLKRETLDNIKQLDLPSLEYLELWLGRNSNGNGDCSIDDLMPIILGKKFPKLRYLGIKNSVLADEIALELAKSPFLDELLELDISMGTLGDEGLLSLLESPNVNELDLINIDWSYISENFIRDMLPQFEIKCQLSMNNQLVVGYNGYMIRDCIAW